MVPKSIEVQNPESVLAHKDVFPNHKEQTDQKHICRLELNIHENLIFYYYPVISSETSMRLENFEQNTITILEKVQGTKGGSNIHLILVYP